MDSTTVSSGIDLAKTLAGLVTAIVSGGPPAWIATGIVVVFGFVLFFIGRSWWKNLLIQWAERDTEQAKQKDQAESRKQNQDAGADWADAEKKTNEAREKAKAEMQAKAHEDTPAE